MVASEAVPFAKTGGLADVCGALPLALGGLGWHVTLVLPRYRGVTAIDERDRFERQVGDALFRLTVWEQLLGDEVTVCLVDCPELFDREALYGTGNQDYVDNARRFAVLSRAALEIAARKGERIDIVHGHDWQCGLVPVYLRRVFASHPGLGQAPVIFTVHNLAYQGLFAPSWLPAVGLPWDVYTLNGLEYYNQVSFLKAGINFADVITTVSPTYAREIQTPTFGFGFEGILRRRSADLVGILNGIDTDEWNPATDRFLPASYDRDHLEGKSSAREALLREVDLPGAGNANRPVIGLVSRMVDQKGFDIISAAIGELMQVDAAWVLLGSGERRYEDEWRWLATAYPERVGVHIGFDNRLAHLIEAGADIFLMPSRFEPCGLNQMYSLRYGTVPVVRATGGLADTVIDVDMQPDAGTGFTFLPPDPVALTVAVDRAVAAWRDRPRWTTIQRRGMAEDHSWDASAREYVKVYERAAAARRSATPATAHPA